MHRIAQSPTDAAFVQDPYPFYERMRALGPVVWWEDYGLPCAVSFAAVNAILRDRRFGREVPPEQQSPVAEHLRPFYEVEAHSMLELEPPRHTRLRRLVVQGFTSARIAALAPQIEALAHRLIDAFPDGAFDLLPAFARPLPVVVIARLLGIPEAATEDLLRWSNAMVAMYQAGRTRTDEDRAVCATQEFVGFLRDHISTRRRVPGNDLISELIAARDAGDRLSEDELISTCILLLNAGHEATVHSIGNGVRVLLETGALAQAARPDNAPLVEEILRFDPPLHMFRRWAYADIEVMGHSFARGDEVACLLAAANRDPRHWDQPDRFAPDRAIKPHQAFGAGLHFCVGAPLARLELQIGFRALALRCPALHLAGEPCVADTYHFHALAHLPVAR